ncbi:MAG: O-linked N-acetylglucosamine transferase, SPINDLY family protein [Pseudanabaena frigida]|uniref:O-linked N-acetylglucosamine transferase, SPINDLY family protein n=1 Tax=Pseudanabaena frigida TaxID=945775 RepID=A0A2W4Y6U5_9CYAN|nr:MAG: O-linked N-acetylglucosamine transferase, SPINDLY family protein [Pseudanabaena frigida]
MTNWQELLLHNDYAQIIQLSQESIDIDPNLGINYCYLGLAYLLQDKIDEARKIWSLGLEKSTSIDLYTKELYEILRQEFFRQEALKEYQIAWEICQNIRFIEPKDFDNLVRICVLSLKLKTFIAETLQDLDFINLIQSGVDINDDSLLNLIVNIAYAPIPKEECIEFIGFCAPYIQDTENCINHLLYLAIKFRLDLALKFIDICHKVSPNNIKVLGCLSNLYINDYQYSKAIEVTRQLVRDFSGNTLDRIASNYLLLSALMSAGGQWQEAEELFKKLQSLLSQIIEQNPVDIPKMYLSQISMTCFFAPYFQDSPKFNRDLQNQIMNLFQSNIQHIYPELVQKFKKNRQLRKGNKQNRKIRIGYLTTSLRQHSVGWLARSLFQHFDRDSFEIYGYFPEYKLGADFLEEWYIGRMHKVYRESVEYWGAHFAIAEQIDRDEIDILVDPESMTSVINLEILSLKPAPLQVTWLGWDASGLPAIDYYIADSYSLPDNAQDYYSEKIWRLPQSYIAVDGFESTIANLSRRELGIPADGIIYFSSQKSYKRHPETVQAQLQIIKQVPNSYFLIKGLSDEDLVQNFFYEIADAEGVERDRLKFLPYAKSEAEHRANLAIADIVLDTFPYNGATTTMETLWMGIPMVTLVGEQFSARNSYTMMKNAGITEGIAWNFQEYVEWGVRFGNDANLRQEVAWKLRQSRKDSPLWDGRQFAREMEKAYRQMWEIYNA